MRLRASDAMYSSKGSSFTVRPYVQDLTAPRSGTGPVKMP